MPAAWAGMPPAMTSVSAAAADTLEIKFLYTEASH
jgi:hypothetical protein